MCVCLTVSQHLALLKSCHHVLVEPVLTPGGGHRLRCCPGAGLNPTDYFESLIAHPLGEIGEAHFLPELLIRILYICFLCLPFNLILI